MQTFGFFLKKFHRGNQTRPFSECDGLELETDRQRFHTAGVPITDRFVVLLIADLVVSDDLSFEQMVATILSGILWPV